MSRRAESGPGSWYTPAGRAVEDRILLRRAEHRILLRRAEVGGLFPVQVTYLAVQDAAAVR
ncbi:MAG TPA: hypothetical protein VEH31_29700 [Streptosporangiaceae bacterium]|nr:hypothetical protein [Streptosporangiaceae bacterium]